MTEIELKGMERLLDVLERIAYELHSINENCERIADLLGVTGPIACEIQGISERLESQDDCSNLHKQIGGAGIEVQLRDKE